MQPSRERGSSLARAAGEPPESAPPGSTSEEDEMDSVVVDAQPPRKRLVSYKLETVAGSRGDRSIDLSSTDSFATSLGSSMFGSSTDALLRTTTQVTMNTATEEALVKEIERLAELERKSHQCRWLTSKRVIGPICMLFGVLLILWQPDVICASLYGGPNMWVRTTPEAVAQACPSTSGLATFLMGKDRVAITELGAESDVAAEPERTFEAADVGAVAARVILACDPANFAVGTPERVAFEVQFQADVAAALGGIASSRVRIQNIYAGSMVVDFLVLPASDGTVLPLSVLTEAFSTAGIEIAGELTAAPVTDAFVVTAADVVEPEVSEPEAEAEVSEPEAEPEVSDPEVPEPEVEPEVSEPEAEPEVSEPEAEPEASEPEVSEPESEPEVSEPEAEPEVSEPEAEPDVGGATGRRRAAEFRQLQQASVDTNTDCCGLLSSEDTQLLLSALRILVDEHNSARAEPEVQPEPDGEGGFGPEPEFLEQRMDVNDAISNFLGAFYVVLVLRYGNGQASLFTSDNLPHCLCREEATEFCCRCYY